MSKHSHVMKYVTMACKVLAGAIGLYYLYLVVQYYQKPLAGPGSHRDMTMGGYAMATSSETPSFFTKLGEAMTEAAVIMAGGFMLFFAGIHKRFTTHHM